MTWLGGVMSSAAGGGLLVWVGAASLRVAGCIGGYGGLLVALDALSMRPLALFSVTLKPGRG